MSSVLDSRSPGLGGGRILFLGAKESILWTKTCGRFLGYNCNNRLSLTECSLLSLSHAVLGVLCGMC